MNIAVIIENFRLNAGGNERSTEQIVRRLVQRGHRVTVLCNRSDAARSLPAECRLQTADGLSTKYGLGLWLFARWVQNHVQQGAYDVTLSMTTAVEADVVQPRSGTVREALLRRLAMRRPGWARFLKRIEMGFHLKRQLALVLEKRTFQSERVRRFAALSAYVAEQMVRHYGVEAGRITVIPNAAEIRPFSPSQRQAVRLDLRARHGVGDGETLFFFAALHAELKGLRELLQAFAEVVRRAPGARLLVAGSASGTLRRLADRLGVGDRITWVGMQESLDAFYVASDVTVLPTWSDSSSKVVLESLLHGTPAISTLHNGASHWILSPDGSRPAVSPYDPMGALAGQNGACAGRVIGSPADTDALAEAMLALCDPAKRAECARAAAGVSDCLTMDRHVDRLEELLREVAGEVPESRERVSPARTVRGDQQDGVPEKPQALNLLLVIEKYFEFGGLQRDMLRIAQACAERGHRVHILCGSWQGAVPSGLEVHQVPLKAWTNHGRIAALEQAAARLARETRVDGVIGFKKMRGLDVYFAGDVCLSARLEESGAGWRRWLPRYRAYLANERAVFRPESVTHILAITPIEQARYQRSYGTPEDRFTLLPPGINRARLVDNVPSAEQRERLRAELGVKPGGLMLLNIGSGFHTKGIDRAIEALASLPGEVRAASVLVVVGVGRPDAFLRQARRLGVGDRVVFTGGRSDVANFYHSADLLVHPARVEAAGHTLLEAMVCGLPVLATAICGYIHHVTDAGAGQVCPHPFRQSDLNRLLLEAVDPIRRQQWRDAALAYAGSHDLYGMVDRAAEAIEAHAGMKRRGR